MEVGSEERGEAKYNLPSELMHEVFIATPWTQGGFSEIVTKEMTEVERNTLRGAVEQGNLWAVSDFVEAQSGQQGEGCELLMREMSREQFDKLRGKIIGELSR